MKTKLPSGPTLNVEYNWLLAEWARHGEPSPPSCEDCECDLTGREVVEKHGWLCEECAQKDFGGEASYREYQTEA